MYIPEQVMCFIFGFITFPIVTYIIYIIGLKNGWIKDEYEEKGENKNEKLEKKK